MKKVLSLNVSSSGSMKLWSDQNEATLFCDHQRCGLWAFLSPTDSTVLSACTGGSMCSKSNDIKSKYQFIIMSGQCLQSIARKRRCYMLNVIYIELKFPFISKTFIALPCDDTAFNVNMVQIKYSTKRKEKDKPNMNSTINRDTKSSSELFVK